jgi:hypothetical protein
MIRIFGCSTIFFLCCIYQLTMTYLLHLSPLQHSVQLQSSYQFLVHMGVNAYSTCFQKPSKIVRWCFECEWLDITGPRSLLTFLTVCWGFACFAYEKTSFASRQEFYWRRPEYIRCTCVFGLVALFHCLRTFITVFLLFVAYVAFESMDLNIRNPHWTVHTHTQWKAQCNSNCYRKGRWQGYLVQTFRIWKPNPWFPQKSLLLVFSIFNLNFTDRDAEPKSPRQSRSKSHLKFRWIYWNE